MVNGYLLFDKEYTLPYLKKKLFHYGRFLILWCLIIGILVSIKNHQLISGIYVLTDVFVGSGWLFHLWFIITLAIIHVAYWIICTYIKRFSISINKVFQWWVPITFILLMNAIYIFDVLYLMPERSLVAIIPIPYRFIRYLGYFVLGLYFGKKKKEKIARPTSNWFLAFSALACFFAICINLQCVDMADIWSTNTFYPSIFCTIGTVAIFWFCMNQDTKKHKKFWSIVNYTAPASIGIWVLHPFARAVLRKLLGFAGLELTLWMRVLLVPVVFIGCMIVSKFALRIKGVRMLFRI